MNLTNQLLILVDQKDHFQGYASREECHSGKGRRHRAFVTLLFNGQNWVTLQKRKHRLFDNLWDLTVCSHNLHLKKGDESYQEASDRTLRKEMGILHAQIKKVGRFKYFAQDGENCENEYCAVLVGRYDGEYEPNKDEVYEIKQIGFEEFVKNVAATPGKYTPWAVLAVGELKKFGPISNL